MISDKGKYPFIIANTDASDKPGVQDGKTIVDKILLGIEQLTRADQKINPLQGKIQSGGLLRPYQKRNRLAERHCKKFFPICPSLQH